MRILCPLTLIALLTNATSAADPVALKVRVTGLFAPDRETDLREVLKAELPGVELAKLDFDHAEAELTFDADAVLPKVKPADRVARLDDRLRGASHGTFGVKPPTAVPRDKLERVKIPVAGLDCKACGLAAYEAVAKLDGVEQATASFKDGLVTALIDPAKTDRAKLEAVLRKRGVAVK